MAVLAQETESRMNGFTPLALKGDEDRSSGELQQAAQSLPEKTGLSGESGNASWSPTPSQQTAQRTGSSGYTRAGSGRHLKEPQ